MNISLFLSIFIVQTCFTTPQLQQVHVIFRHGDRTPIGIQMFPTDPNFHKRTDYDPTAIGELTDVGKLRCSKLGEFLRKRYDAFIGDRCYSDLIYARATWPDRIKVSLQLVLAALFPCPNEQKCHKNLDWQSIPILFPPKGQDDVLGPSDQTAWRVEKGRVMKLMKNRIDEFREFASLLTNLTGKPMTTTFKMKSIYDTLVCEQNMNWTLVNWSKEMFPDGKLLETALLEFDVQTYDTEVIHFLNGKLMAKMTQDMLTAMNKKEIGERDTKLFLYSGHDVNVSGVLRSLRVYQPHIPYFNSAVIIELLKDHEEYYVKVLYYHGNTSQLEELKMPGCSELCPFGKYTSDLEYLLNFKKTQ